MADTLYDRGRAVRCEVLGEAHVARSEARASAFDADYQRYITEHAWGAVWTRPGLDRKTRSMLTVAVLAALGRDEELALHLRGSRNNGVSDAELRETLLQVAVYAGAPAANSAFAIAKKVFPDLSNDPGAPAGTD